MVSGEDVLVDLAIGVCGGLVVAVVLALYQSWLNERSKWPFKVEVIPFPDPAHPRQGWVRLEITNRTSRRSRFDVFFDLGNGSWAIPFRLALYSDPARNLNMGEVEVGARDREEFQVIGGDYGGRTTIGLVLMEQGGMGRIIRQRVYPLDFSRSVVVGEGR